MLLKFGKGLTNFGRTRNLVRKCKLDLLTDSIAKININFTSADGHFDRRLISTSSR